MKKTILSIALAMITINSFADYIYKHNGEKIECQILSVERDCVKFSYKNEKAANTLGKYSIAKVVFDSGREQTISDKIDAENYENIVITDDANEVVGLKELKAITAHSDNDWNFGSANSLDKKANRKLRKQAAGKGAIVVLIQRENINSSFSKSSTKKGTCYTY